MKSPQHTLGKTFKLMLVLGLLVPFLVASFTSQIISANALEMFLAFCTIFLFSSLSYWITLRTITQWLDE